MEKEESRSSLLAAALDEEGHYFDFIGFYKKVEFCDRKIRLEILDESKKDLENARPRRGAKKAAEAPPQSEEIPVNSIVVAAKSRVLRTMLSNGMKESAAGAPVVLKVTEEEKDAFKEMLHFLYAGVLPPRFFEPTTDVRELVGLIVVGDKFEVPSLIGAVLKCLNQRAPSVSDSAVLAVKIPDALQDVRQIQEIKSKALAHIIETFADVSGMWGTEGFLGLDVEVVGILLRSEELEADSEEEIFDKVLEWSGWNLRSLEEKKSALEYLTPHVRFLCMRGEYLEGLTVKPELQSSAMQKLIKEALRFRVYSHTQKLKLWKKSCSEREGVQRVHLELIAELDLKDGGKTVSSRSAIWFGKRWCIQLQSFEGREGPSTIGIFLCSKKLFKDEGETAKGADIADIAIYIKHRPSGCWEERLRFSRLKFSFEDPSTPAWGSNSVLNMPWSEARRSASLMSPLDTIGVKIEARRYREPEPPPK